MEDFPSLSSYFHKTISILLDRKELSRKTDCFHGSNSQNTPVLRERLALKLDRKIREQFSRICLGFFVKKTTDTKLVVARGSSLKISIELHVNVFKD